MILNLNLFLLNVNYVLIDYHLKLKFTINKVANLNNKYILFMIFFSIENDINIIICTQINYR